MKDEPKILNQRKAAEYVGVSIWTIQDWEEAGKLQRLDVAAAWYSIEALDALIASRKQHIPPPAPTQPPLKVSDLP